MKVIFPYHNQKSTFCSKGVYWIHIIKEEENTITIYDKINDRWVRQDDVRDFTVEKYSTACLFGKSLRAVLRKIRKWDLPKGTVIRARGYYAHEMIIIKI